MTFIIVNTNPKIPQKYLNYWRQWEAGDRPEQYLVLPTGVRYRSRNDPRRTKFLHPIPHSKGKELK